MARRSHGLLAAALLVGALRATAVCAQPVLRWGADPSGGAPHVFVDPQNPDRYVGFEKEFVEALAAVLGRRPVMVPTDWETIVSALERGEFDIIVNGLEPTTDRAKHILFSKPYYLFRQQLVVRRQENRIRTLADCRDKLVGTLVNTTSSRLLAREGIRYKAYADPPVAYRDLELGRVDAVLMDLPIAQYYAFPNPNLKPAGEPFYVSAYVVGLRKDDRELKAQIDAAIDTLLRNGTMERILRKWNLWDELQAQLAQGEARYDMAASEFNWGEALWRLLRAAAVTVALAFGAMGVALLLGIPLALGQERGPPGVRALCTGYIEFFRGTPVLVQLLFLYFGLPKLGIVLPGWLTALVGLGLNYAAYESQVYRAAFAAVPRGQWEVAYALGMGRALAFRRVILPQAFRVALPPMTNDFVALFKDTSVAFAISVWELATAYRELANASQQFLLLGAITSGLYLAMSLPLARLARRLEARLQRERAREIPHGEEVRA